MAAKAARYSQGTRVLPFTIDLFNNKDYNLVSNPIEEPILSIGIYIKYIK